MPASEQVNRLFDDFARALGVGRDDRRFAGRSAVAPSWILSAVAGPAVKRVLDRGQQ